MAHGVLHPSTAYDDSFELLPLETRARVQTKGRPRHRRAVRDTLGRPPPAPTRAMEDKDRESLIQYLLYMSCTSAGKGS